MSMLVGTQGPPPRLAQAHEGDLVSVTQATQRERDWYQSHTRFLTDTQITVYASRGELHKVTPDSNVVPTARFRNPDLHFRFPPYLLPDSLLAYRAVGWLWRQRLADDGIPRPDVRLAGTSFARSQMYQADLIEAGALATLMSTHCVGAAFDLDASGYYVFTPDSGLESVAHPDRAGSLKLVASHLGDRSLANSFATRESAEPYDERITNQLIRAVTDLHDAGMLNRVVEFPGTHNQCVHLAPNPEVDAGDWRQLSEAHASSVWMG